MNMRESLEVAQDRASVMLATQYDEQRGFPLRAGSHGDLWPGDRWVEAYIAINETERAAEVMAAITRSIRPDGSVPHLMQGSHKRLGLETNCG